jgi:hypothetical protein
VDVVIRGGLHEYLDRLQLKMNEIDSSLRDDFAVRLPAAPPVAPAEATSQSQSQTQTAASQSVDANQTA